jgi:acetyl-CoA acetyltransferase
MTTDPLTPEDGALVEVEPETTPLVETTPLLDHQIKQETKDLIAAIQTKAASEAQKAGEFARESYLETVRKAREEIENLNLFEPERIDEAIKRVQTEVEKDWASIAKEIGGLSDRLNEATKAAWEVLTAPRSDK